MSVTNGDWPKIPYGQPKATAYCLKGNQVFVPTLPYEVHRTNEKHEMDVVASGKSSAYIMRICRLLREDEKLHNRKWRDVSYKVYDHAAKRYLGY